VCVALEVWHMGHGDMGQLSQVASVTSVPRSYRNLLVQVMLMALGELSPISIDDTTLKAPQ